MVSFGFWKAWCKQGLQGCLAGGYSTRLLGIEYGCGYADENIGTFQPSMSAVSLSRLQGP